MQSASPHPLSPALTSLQLQEANLVERWLRAGATPVDAASLARRDALLRTVEVTASVEGLRSILAVLIEEVYRRPA